MTVEGLLFSKNGGGASITLGYRTKDDSTTSYVAAEHMVNKPGGTRIALSVSLSLCLSLCVRLSDKHWSTLLRQRVPTKAEAALI